MRKLGLVVVFALLPVSIASAQDMKKKDAAATPPPAAPAPKKDAAAMPPAGKEAMPPKDAKMKPPEPAPAAGNAMMPPKPAPELAALGPLAMNWKCEGTMKDPMGGPDVAYRSSWKSKWDLNKMWLSIEYTANMKTKPPMSFTGKGFMGYDAAGKSYMFGGVDTMGGYIALRATGWDGNNIVFAGDAAGPMGKMATRFTFTKSDGDKTLGFKIEMQKGTDWMQMQSETCKK